MKIEGCKNRIFKQVQKTLLKNTKNMKTIKIKLFKFEELSEEAQKTAISNFSPNVDNSYIYDDAYQTVKKFNDLFNICEGSRSWLDFRINHIEDNILNLKGLRLRKWLINNFGEQLCKGKFYASIGDNKVIKHPCIKTNFYNLAKGARVASSNFYYSRIQKTKSCVFTGVCYDDSILKPIYNFIDNFKTFPSNEYQTFEDLIIYCFDSLRKDIQNECEYLTSEESIKETLISNEYDFTEEGEIY